MFRQKVKISSLFTDELLTAKVIKIMIQTVNNNIKKYVLNEEKTFYF